MRNNKIIKIAAISGSLKSTSLNTNILRAIAKIAPENVVVYLVEGLDSLPHFNPENEEEIESLTNFRQQLKKADGIIFSTPEYAYGVPGVLKNALDWVVSSGELYQKPVAAISASSVFSGGDKALASLILTLTALGAGTTINSTLSIANIKSKISESGEVTDPETILSLKSLFSDLLSRISAE
jgi:chromate reductase, NAD(P)H dehydrogenase (quinone)